MATINKHINPILEDKFHELLQEEELAHVGFKDAGNGFRSYHMFEYVEEWAKYCRVVNGLLKEQTGEEIFTRKYNKKLLGQLQEIVDGITAEDVVNAKERFKSAWLDGSF